MRKILIRGLDAAVGETAIRSGLARFGSVVRVAIERDQASAKPIALVEMDISDMAAEYLVFRLNSPWRKDSEARAELMDG